MKSKANLKFQSLPIADDNQKIEVAMDENGQVTLRLSTWAENLGWRSQKTMNFDGEMLEELNRALSAARLKFNQQRIESGREIQSGNVLTFPVAA